MYGPQYMIFNDAPELSDKTILAWMDNAEAVDKITTRYSARTRSGWYRG